jgi:primase-polymerase (primpol)-like protein
MKLPRELTERRQWILWRYEQRDGAVKPTKVPYTCAGYKASSTNPQHWSSFEYALKMSQRPGFCDGIGFVFTADDPFCGIDLDNVWPSDAAETALWAEGIIQRFADTYGEASPSDTGYKIWCRAKPSRCGKWPIQSGAIEVYNHGRYFAVTGRSNGILTIADHQADIDQLIGNLSLPEDVSRKLKDRIQLAPDAEIPRGQRHPRLVSLAGTMWSRGMDPAAIEAALLVVNQNRCVPPYTPGHIHKIAQSTARWPR